MHALLRDGAAERDLVEPLLHPADTVTMHLPATVGDYTDFYVGINHAVTVGELFRPDNPLLPNYKWVPIGYHGRASSIRVSGEPFRRPNGQRKNPADAAPTFGPSEKLDFELELGIWIGSGNAVGDPVPIGEAADNVAGYCLLNDWSSRDIQSWEYQPLGPFLSKNFASTISAWVVTPEALAPYRVAAPVRPEGDPAPLAYLDDPADQANGGLDIDLEVLLTTQQMREEGIAPQRLSLSSTQHMYWTVAQMIAHHTSGGCDLRPGDLLGSGTISAPGDDGYGSLLEMTRNGTRPLTLPTGETRTFLQDGDEILLRARAHRPGAAPIGFGECRAVVLPATNQRPADPAPRPSVVQHHRRPTPLSPPTVRRHSMTGKAFASSADLGEKTQTLEVLGDGVYALTAEGDPNVGAIEGDDFVVAFEALATPVAATPDRAPHGRAGADHIANICGSDLHMYECRTDFEPGRWFGHENMSRVAEPGRH